MSWKNEGVFFLLFLCALALVLLAVLGVESLAHAGVCP